MIFADFLVRLWRREGKKHGVPREPSAIPMLPSVVAESEFQERVRAWIKETGGMTIIPPTRAIMATLLIF
jgi:hypothetical protein